MKGTIILKDINIQNIINQTINMLSLKELLEVIDYDINNIYLDKFWNSIEDDKWIYLDNDTILWLGYQDIRRGKDNICKLLKRNFIEIDDYKILNHNEFILEKFLDATMASRNVDDEKRGIHNKQYIITSPDCFKELCMHVGTEKAKEIKRYYINLEKVFKFYLEYQNQYQQLQNQKILNELENEKQKNIKYTYKIIKERLLELNEYIYIATSKINSELNIFKIGMTKHIETRVGHYNTGRIADDEFYYVYILKCYDCESLERMIFNRLSHFQYTDHKDKKYRELYQIHYDTLIEIFKEFEKFEMDNTNNLNKIFNDYYHVYKNTEPKKFEDIRIDNIQEHIDTKYKSSFIVNSKTKLNDITINEKLQIKGVTMISKYNGKYEEEMEFECMSIFKHRFKMTYAHMVSKKKMLVIIVQSMVS